MSVSKPEEQLAYELSCAICLQIYSDPVALPCGHNYCQACIFQSTDKAEETDTVLRCPECRTEFPGVQSLQKNFKLSSIIEGYLAASSKLSFQQESQKKPAEECDDPTCEKVPQEVKKSEAQRLKLELKCCDIHRRPLEYFCSTDMTLLCSKCFMEGQHHSHDVLTFGVAEEEMRHALEVRTKVVSGRLKMTEFLVQKAKEEQGESEAIGDKLVNRAVTLVEAMAGLVDGYRERLHKLLEEERGQHRKSWQLGLSALEEKQQLLVDAQQCAAQALEVTDTCAFINRFMSIEQKMQEAVTGTIPCKILTKAPLNTKQLQAGLKTDAFQAEMSRLCESLCILLNPLELTFNSCTAHPSLQLTNDQRTAKYSPSKQPYSDHPERFTSAPQVMCSQGFSSGEHVWVVEVGPNSMWSLGVCYKSIPRRGDHSRLGHNSVSWRLQWKNGKLTVCKSSSNVVLREMVNQPVKIEVALDYEGGTLMFHSIKGHREHLYTFKAGFKEAVYPAFSIHSNTPDSWITLQCGL
ncbi:E3 ubiquitin-protein ligase Midline-1-like [Dunckerocampus dactyliophorus]|uniref:E3 ubiquitin-protein ligase Midline-1-like n=1 Tax=Dunckerocampus dactyliophorus TaxID=161453 RepID=UPI002405375E|nr:E3 ubiquitin-protein ligase Midline-1-like [Dunckerocampus dactyliophorus]